MSVRIPQDSERSGLVRIEGDPKGVQLARRELIEMVQRMVRMGSKFRSLHSFNVMVIRKEQKKGKSSVHTLENGPLILFSPHFQENERTKDLIVEQKFHRTIIGQKGEKIKEVRDKFPEVNVRPSCALSRLFISGNLF